MKLYLKIKTIMKNLKNFYESAYSDTSKSIGWNNTSVNIPAIEEIEQLVVDAENGDQNAFRKLFSLNRFANPKDMEEVTRLNIAVDGFRKTKHLFESITIVKKSDVGNNISAEYHVNKSKGKKPYIKKNGVYIEVDAKKSIPKDAKYMTSNQALKYNKITNQIKKLEELQNSILK